MTKPATPKAAKTPKRQQRGPEQKVLTRAGVAVGVGSAAIVAALLYAGRPKRQKPPQ